MNQVVVDLVNLPALSLSMSLDVGQLTVNLTIMHLLALDLSGSAERCT